MQVLKDSKLFLSSNLLNNPLVSHGFFGKVGGKSSGFMQSLNIGLNDIESKEITQANRNIVEEEMGFNKTSLVTIKQVHGTNSVLAEDALLTTEADSIVSNKQGVLIGILTADCAPILFADFQAKIVAVAHAGHRGAFNNIMASTVKKMEDLGAKKSNIVAVIGPCIHQESYEVGPEFYEKFITTDSTYKRFFIESVQKNHYMFNLPSYIEAKLNTMNLAGVDLLNYDTYSNEESFYSYRRRVHKGEPFNGLQVSVIGLR